MWVTHEEAIEMYARFWATRHGDAAVASARKRASALEQNGDAKGFHVWNEVADVIEEKRRERRSVRH